MTEQLAVTIERVDDIPVLIASMDRLGLAELADEYFVLHGNWRGLSLGKVLTGWLAHILSEGDHRLNRVEDWAAKRVETLRGCLDAGLRALDFTDDRLAISLDILSDDQRWAQFETALSLRRPGLWPSQTPASTTRRNRSSAFTRRRTSGARPATWPGAATGPWPGSA